MVFEGDRGPDTVARRLQTSVGLPVASTACPFPPPASESVAAAGAFLAPERWPAVFGLAVF